MPFTAQEIENVANASLEYHYQTPDVRSQTLQEKPLLKAMMAKEKSFPGGKDYITRRVKGVYSTTIQGFEHNDTVSYGNPANIKEAKYQWKLVHAGLEITMHELLKNGISITDTTTGKNETRHSDSEKIQLADLMKDKVEDMMEGFDRGMNNMFWKDGTQDSKQVPGIRSFILDDPTSATIVGGIDQSANTWWRNRAKLDFAHTTPSDLAICKGLQKEWRQLRRYGGRPDTVLCGSDWIEAMEAELFSKGNFTLDGWTATKNTDGSMADISFKGVKFQYDPTLDDMSLADYCYVLDSRTIQPMAIEGESMKKHNPARPESKYVFYRAMTWVGGLICDQRNANGVYALA
jgi:hypothetical protein